MPTKYAIVKTLSSDKDALNPPIEGIFKKYDSFDEAQQANQNIFLEYYRFPCEALNQTNYYADYVYNTLEINHLKYLKKHYFIDFEGLLADTPLKDFKYKTVVGWFSVELLEALLNYEALLPIQEPWQTRMQVLRSYAFALVNQQKAFWGNRGLSFWLSQQLYPLAPKYQPFELSLEEQYAYAATHFNIDFQKIWASKYVKKFKYKKYLDEFFRRLFGLMVFQSDKAILDLVSNPFKIIELTEITVFYKLYTNPTFSEYQNPNNSVGFRQASARLYDGQSRYFLQPEQAADAIGQLLWRDLTQLDLNPPYQLNGTLSELSVNHVLLQSYLSENQLFKYDYKLNCLTLQQIQLPLGMVEKLMFGLVQLLRPSKLPYYWEIVPHSLMNEIVNNPAQADNHQPFTAKLHPDLPF